MDVSRRSFLQYAGVLVAAAAFPPLVHAEYLWAPEANNDVTFWPILQGPTDSDSTTIIVLHPAHADFGIEVRGGRGERIPFVISDRMELPESMLVVSQISVQRLVPGVDFHLQLLDARGKIFDRRVFRSLRVDRRDCRFAVVSCMSDRMGGKMKSMWNALAREKCDFVFFLGDTCYADNGHSGKAAAGYARRYAETRATLGWFRQARLTPSFATWDDHDFGLNNADRNFPFAPYTKKLFRAFWGDSENSSWRKKYGVGSVLEAFGQRFYLLDDRSFRDFEGVKGGSHWGRQQTEWLLGDLQRSSKPAWLMNGGQFFGGYLGKESFEAHHPLDFSRFLKRLKQVKAPVVFVSGDIHFSEVMEIEEAQLEYKTYEFTSSAMHSLTHPFRLGRQNPRRLAAEWRHNFLVFDSKCRDGLDIQLRCVRDGNKTSFHGGLRVARG